MIQYPSFAICILPVHDKRKLKKNDTLQWIYFESFEHLYVKNSRRIFYSEPSPVIQESLQTKEDGEKNKVPEKN